MRPFQNAALSCTFVHIRQTSDKCCSSIKPCTQKKGLNNTLSCRQLEQTISFLVAAHPPPRETEFVILVVLVTHGWTTLITTQQTSLRMKWQGAHFNFPPSPHPPSTGPPGAAHWIRSYTSCGDLFWNNINFEKRQIVFTGQSKPSWFSWF